MYGTGIHLYIISEWKEDDRSGLSHPIPLLGGLSGLVTKVEYLKLNSSQQVTDGYYSLSQ